ncbi:MAG: hypothetical protein P1U68_16940 [Verrucomicrobiales bacterium]|nr:hypothetical protein [Verrucomicrobiales bacterium]
MANRFKIHSSHAFLFLSLTFFFSSGEEPARQMGIIFEGGFESPDIARKPSGAEKTLMVPFYQWDYGIRPFSKEQWDEQELEWEELVARSSKLGDLLMEKVEAREVRDERGVVRYAFLAAMEPFLSTVVFSDKFREKFKDTLGDSLLIVFIDRQLLYAFPAVGGSLEEYGPSLVDEFRVTPLPVSLEVFLLNDSGMKVIGELSREGSPP